ncbi:MAG TPA: histidine phosphatase family protein [Luteolibacter sp.]|nr:histidine phosphatase family protein [Luteolibacter sp.]
MELVILRHGKAEDSSPDGDYGRNLVEKGRRQSRDAASTLQSGGLLPEIVLCSPLNRARQTAEEFCSAAGIVAPIVVNWLACGMSPETALNELVGFREFNRIAIVGHEPDLSELIQWLLGARGGSIEVSKGTIACLRVYPPAKIGTLIYLAPPSITGD